MLTAVPGMTMRQLDHWSRLGGLRSDMVKGPGRTGKMRVWPESEVRVARMLFRLSQAGVRAEVAATIARSTPQDVDAAQVMIGPQVMIVIRGLDTFPQCGD